jgi:hypothetical protein
VQACYPAMPEEEFEIADPHGNWLELLGISLIQI